MAEALSAYYDRLATTHGYDYHTSDASSWEGLQRRWTALAEELPLTGTVLDVGCGIGYGSRVLTTYRPDLAYTGIDLSQEAVGVGLRKDPHLRLLVGDAREHDGKYTAVVSQGPFYKADGPYALSLIRAMWAMTEEVLAFTARVTWDTHEEADEYRIHPGGLLSFLVGECSELVSFRALWPNEGLFVVRVI